MQKRFFLVRGTVDSDGHGVIVKDPWNPDATHVGLSSTQPGGDKHEPHEELVEEHPEIQAAIEMGHLELIGEAEAHGRAEAMAAITATRTDKARGTADTLPIHPRRAPMDAGRAPAVAASIAKQAREGGPSEDHQPYRGEAKDPTDAETLRADKSRQGAVTVRDPAGSPVTTPGSRLEPTNGDPIPVPHQDAALGAASGSGHVVRPGDSIALDLGRGGVLEHRGSDWDRTHPNQPGYDLIGVDHARGADETVVAPYSNHTPEQTPAGDQHPAEGVDGERRGPGEHVPPKP